MKTYDRRAGRFYDPNAIEAGGGPAPDAVKLLTVEQVAERLACSPSKVYRMARTGLMPSVKVGGSVRVSSLELAEWIGRGCR